MDEDPKDNKNDEDSSTKYILEYYQKYSQNKKLPKYFSGTSIAYLPEIVDEQKPITDVKINVITAEDEQTPPQVIDELELSPTGSIASHKKLEWDNLADIGYYNASTVHRSSSLPIISPLNTKHLQSTSGGSSNVKVIIYPYSSSSEDKSFGANVEYTSSSSSHTAKKDPTPISTTSSSAVKERLTITDSSSEEKVLSFKQTLDYLKSKIGLPDAQSTPAEAKSAVDSIDLISNTPFIPKHEKPAKKLLNKTKYIDEAPANEDIEPLCEEKSNLAKKVVNLCLTKPLLLDCVSKTITAKQLTIGIQTETKDNQSNTGKTPTDTGKSSSSNFVASNCDSFEYIKNNEKVQIAHENQIPQPSIDVTSMSKTASDIEKNIYVLQKLLKSKKYDPATKKKYTKKILQKIIESRYLEDSSTSSDLFYPKTDPSKVLKDQIKYSFYKNEGSSSSYQSHEDQKNSPSKRKPEFIKNQISMKEPKGTFSKNVQSKSSSLSSPRKKKSQSGTADALTKDMFDIGKNELGDFKETKKGLFTVITKEHCGDKINPEENYLSSSTPKSYENWRKLETNSELKFENNGKSLVGDGDHLIINFADKERQYQLNWIDREINHLGKLKSLLEKPKKPYDLGENVRKTTSVYMVSGSDSIPRRNYVIETNLGVKGTQPRTFCLEGQNYIVCDPRSKETGLNKKFRTAVADIEVHSDEKTTNIKVKTICNECHKVPCVCNSVVNLSQHEIMTPHDEEPSCSTKTSSKSSEKGSSCGICQKAPCLCSNDKQVAKSSKYSDCQCSSRSCHCGKSATSKRPTKCYSIPVKGYVPCPNGTEEESEVCLCDLALSENSNSSKENQSESLTKIFKNCKCDKQDECNCNFVTKLLKCFGTHENLKSKNLQRSEAQEELPCKDNVKYSDKNVGTEKTLNINTVNVIIDNKNGVGEQTQTSARGSPIENDGIEKCTCYNPSTTFCAACKPEKLVADLIDSKKPTRKNSSPPANNTKRNSLEQCTCEDLDECSCAQRCQCGDTDQCTCGEVDEKIKRCTCSNVDLCTCQLDVDVDEVNKCSPDYLNDLVSRIEQALLDRNGKKKDKRTKARPMDRSTTYSPPQRDQFTTCIPENVQFVQCSNKPLGNDKSTTYSPRADSAICTPDTCLISEGTNQRKKKANKETSYTPRVEDEECVCDEFTTSAPEKVQFVQCTNQGIDKSTTYSPLADNAICTPDTCLINEGTNQRKKKANKETSYKPPVEDVECVCDEPSDLKITAKSKSPKDKDGKGTLSLQVSKDVKSIDMCFCLCGSKKSLDKNGNVGECSCGEKKKKHHKKSCACKCKHCLSSSSTVSSNSTSNKPKKCRCACKCGFSKKDRTCCGKEKTKEPCTADDDTTTGSLSTNATDPTPVLVCALCNRTTPYDKVSMLRTNTEEYALCSKCMGKKPILTSTCYVGPDLESDTRPSSNQSHTVTDFIHRTDSFCTCPKGPRLKNKPFEYCSHCCNQLRRTLKSKNGIAYTLTLEDELSGRCRKTKSKNKPKLREIKVKVPCPYNRKKGKDKENGIRKDGANVKQVESEENSDHDENCQCRVDMNSNSTETKSSADKKAYNEYYTLQDHLKKNRPDFIDSAEYRRQAVLNNREERELNKDDMKLKFLKQNEKNNAIKRQNNKLFTEQEMREITKRNYKKLPEVQKRQNVLRLQKLRSADKCITDMFKKKIQNCILKGKSSFPIDTNIVNYYK